MRKLTLSADADVIEQAKRLAKEHGTSVSAMFSDFIRAHAAPGTLDRKKLGPLTRKALGLAKLPNGKSYRKLIEQSIMEKHGR